MTAATLTLSDLDAHIRKAFADARADGIYDSGGGGTRLEEYVTQRVIIAVAKPLADTLDSVRQKVEAARKVRDLFTQANGAS